MKLFISLSIILLSTCSLLFSSVDFTKEEKEWIKSNPIVKLGADYRWPPFDFADSRGNHTGLSSEYIKLISKKSGLKFDIQTGIWSDILTNMKAKKYDGLTCAVETSERKKYLKFSDPYLTVPSVIVVRSDDNTIKSTKDLFKKTVAVNKDSYTQEWLESYYPEIKLYFVTSSENALEAVSLSKVDAYVGNQAVTTYIMNKNLLNNLKIVTKLKGFDTAVSVAIDKEKTILFNIIQKSLNAISPQEHQKIKKKWKENIEFNNTLLSLTKEEQLWIAKHKTISVGGEMDWAPFDFVDEKGDYSGVAKDYLDLIAQISGLEFNIITGKTWEELLRSFRNGEIDLLPAIYKNDKRKEYMDFTHSYLSLDEYYFTKIDKEKITFLDELNGKTLAVVKGYDSVQWLEKNYPKIILLKKNSIKECLESVSSNESYAFFGDNPSTTYYIEKGFMSDIKLNSLVRERKQKDVYMGVRKDFKLLTQIINKSIENITLKQKSKIIKRWINFVEKDNLLSFSNKQREWLKKNKVIKYVIDNHWMPIEYLSEKTKKHEGISSSYLDIVSKKTGIRFEMIYSDSWINGIKKINNKEADMYACVSKTDDREKVVNFSTPYLKMAQVFVTNKEVNYITDIKELYDKKLVLIDGYSITKTIEKNHPQIDIIKVEKITDAFKLLTKGEAYAYIDTLPIASYYIQKKGYSNLKISGMTTYEFEFSIALRKDLGIEGIEIINKALNSITEKEKSEIYNKWLHVKYDKEVDYTLVWQVSIVVFIFILGTLYWNRKLSAEIKKRKLAQAELIDINKKLELATQSAQSASRAKSDFLSNMSHEIRTPMNAILGFAELLDEQIEDKKQKSFLKTIRTSGETLLVLINDILDLSKIESGKLEIVKTKVNVKNIFQECMSIFELQTEAKGIKLELELDENMPTSLLLDAVRFKEVLINLIGNAIKFTQDGYVKVVVVVDDVYEHNSKIDLTYRVQDSGIGIDKENIEKIFNMFEQSENQDIRRYGGTGLGLAISRKLTILMGGMLEVESELGVGSSFIASFKNIDIASLSDGEDIYESNLEHNSIVFKHAVVLVVDDIKENRDLVKESLGSDNVEILEATNGKEAVDIAKEKELNLILMDIRMPVMDGYSATRIIKEFSDVAIVALTASIMKMELKKLKYERFDGYLRKPVTKNELYKEVSKFLDYENIDTTEDDSEEDMIIQNAEELKKFLDEIDGDLKELYEKAKITNDLNVIIVFCKKLQELSLKYDVKNMISYSELLLEKIDTFEIDSIGIMLKDYENKIKILYDTIK